jgi:hypothetical protein
LEFGRAEHHARVRREPEERNAFVRPREDADGVSRQDAFRRQVAADGQQTVLVGQFGRWEGDVVGEFEHSHV